jgi:cytoskeletal protein CcmA (bactofilin family)
MAIGSNAYTELGASSGLSFNTNNRTLTVAALTVTNTTISNSTSTGALRVFGGVGIGGNLYVGGDIVAQKLTIEYTTVTTTLVETDDVIITNNTTNATSTQTGALIVAGGAGFGGDVYIGGNLYPEGIIGSISTASNIADGTTNQIPYQVSSGVTGFFGPGSAGQVLLSNGLAAGGPIFVNQSELTVGTATSSTFADNLVGGAAGSLPYQNGPDDTVFLNLGTLGYILTAGSTQPVWSDPEALTIAYAITATNLADGAAGSIPYQTAPGLTTFLGIGSPDQILTINGSSLPVWVDRSVILVTTASFAIDLLGGATGSLPYQSNTDDTTFLAIGSPGQILRVSNSNTPEWIDASAVSVTTASFAADLLGGAPGSLPYQANINDTTFLAIGSENQILTVGSGNTLVWKSPSVISVTT